MALRGGLARPFHRVAVALRDAFTVPIEQREMELGCGVVLLGRHPVPPHGLDGIGLHAEAEGVHIGNIALRFGVTRLGERLPFGEGSHIVAALIGCGPFFEAGEYRLGRKQGKDEERPEPCHFTLRKNRERMFCTWCPLSAVPSLRGAPQWISRPSGYSAQLAASPRHA